jgi:hypothetical protein
MGDCAPVNPAAIDRVMAVVEVEGDDHLTSHWVLARKVLGEPKAFAHDVATAFRHRKLTREDCERMADGWDDMQPETTKEEQ